MRGVGMNVAVVGCGVVGRRRAAVAAAAGCRVVAVYDTDAGRARAVADEVGAVVVTDRVELLADDRVDAVVVATTPRWLAEVSAEALAQGRHVLCEKPGGIEAAPVAANARAAREAGLVYQVGYTHRFHSHIRALEEAVGAGEVGRVHFVRGVMGNGARPGFEREWRAERNAAGGGAAMDLGVHLLDLTAAVVGPLTVHDARLACSHWRAPAGAVVEDNAILAVTGHGGTVGTLHASWTQWSNLFTYEVSGELGAFRAHGLGGTKYGQTALVQYGHSRGGTRPTEKVAYFDSESPEVSWVAEWEHFAGLVGAGAAGRANGVAAGETLGLVTAAYASGLGDSVVERS
ncbi:Gfo/Idh/MocA family protein [Streptomyces sp. NPDC054784]